MTRFSLSFVSDDSGLATVISGTLSNIRNPAKHFLETGPFQSGIGIRVCCYITQELPHTGAAFPLLHDSRKSIERLPIITHGHVGHRPGDATDRVFPLFKLVEESEYIFTATQLRISVGHLCEPPVGNVALKRLPSQLLGDLQVP